MTETTTGEDSPLPDGWAWVQCQELCEKHRALTYGVIKLGPDVPGGVPTLRTSDVKPLYIDESGIKRIAPNIASEYHRTTLRGGEVLVNVRGTLGGVAVAPPHMGGYNVSREVAVVPVSSAVSPQYVAYAVASKRSQNWLTGVAKGVTYTGINIEDLKQLSIPLAPYAEQKRITAAIEALLQQVNAARARLERVPEILKRFRQAVLAAACSGRLTEDWRADFPEVETGGALLHRIRTDRTAWRGKHGLNSPPNEDEFEVISTVRPDYLPSHPSVWAVARIEELLDCNRTAAYGVLQPGLETSDGVPMIRVCDIQNWMVLTEQLKRIAPEIDSQYRRTRVQGGELLVTLVGTIGRTAVAPRAAAGANVARAVAVVPLCSHVLPQYISLTLSEPQINAALIDLAREVARKTLNLGLLKAFWIPLPSLEEQKEIVRRVESLFAVADRIERRLAATGARVERLTQAILSKAFRGELVPTEAELARQEGREYEAASALLERIRREAQLDTPRKQPRRRRSNTSW